MLASNDVVNDALGLAQFITKSLNETEAVQFLCSIQSIALEEWKSAKLLLPEAVEVSGRTRTTKEATVKDICSAFYNENITTRFLVANLSLVPGFQAEAIQLASYTAQTLHAVKIIASNIAPVNTIANTANNCTIHPSTQAATPPTQIFPEGDSPIVRTHSYASITGGGNARDFRRNQPRKRNINRSVDKQGWTNGANHTEHNNAQVPQQRSVCLALKSGPNETVDSLETLFDGWNQLIKDRKIEAVSKSDFFTLFRVKFVSSAAHFDKWTEPKTWPARISVRSWRGDPRKELKPLNNRVYRKKLYVGKLSPEITMDKVVSNLNTIYKEEIQAKKIMKIEAFLNQGAWNRQQQLTQKNLNYVTHKSVCVVITSDAGQSLADLGLKLERYERSRRQAVRFWTGPVPWPLNHEEQSSVVELQW